MAVDMNKLVNLDRLKEFQTSENASTASEFSTSKSYAAGAYVYYKGKLYKFKSAHAAGAWTTTDVEEAKLADDVSSLKESFIKLAPAKVGNGNSVTINGGVVNTQIKPFIINFPYDSNGYSDVTIFESNENICGGIDFANAIKSVISQAVINKSAKTVAWAASQSGNKDIVKYAFKDKTQYTIILGLSSSNTQGTTNLRVIYTDNTYSAITKQEQTEKQTIVFVTTAGKSVKSIRAINVSGTNTLYYDECGIFEGVLTAQDYVAHNGLSVSASFTQIYGGKYDVENGKIVSMYDASGNELNPPVEYSASAYTFEIMSSITHVWVDKGELSVGFASNTSSYVEEEIKDALKDTTIIVAPSGGDYTSFTQAIYENINTQNDIIVKAGTYDIVAEYVALFGQDVVDSLADSTEGINGFQYGIRIYNHKITFEAGSKLVCDWTGHTVNGTHRFSALAPSRNCTLDGLYLECIGTFYAVHDDYGGSVVRYKNVYKNCVIIASNLYNDNVIGGGCGKYSETIIENCYFTNGNTTGITIRYHNTGIWADAEPIIRVSNTFCGQGMSFRWNGNQTTKMKVYVNNCKATYIAKNAEGASENDNVELYEWNNEVSA